MTMFAGRPFLPMLQAAMSGQIPGAILEGYDPRLTAEAVGAPVPASGEFLPPPLKPDAPYLGNSPTPSTGRFSGPTVSPVSSSAPTPAESGPRPMYGDPIPQIPDHMRGINASLARNAAIGAQQPQKKGFGEFLKTWAGTLGDTLTGNPVFAEQLKHNRRLEELDHETRRKAMLPQQVGSSIIVPDGQGGYTTLFRDPSTPEAYALAQGFKSGSDEYAEAVRQYRLGSWSDDAMDARLGLTGYRYDRQDQLVDRRYGYQHGLQEDRQKHSDGQLNRRLSTTQRGQNISRDNNIRSTRQSDTNNQRSTNTSRDNNIRTNETRIQTSRRGRGAPVRVRSLEEARRLSPGTVFITPDGRVKVR